MTPLRVLFSDLQRRLHNRFSPELSPETVVERIDGMRGEQLLVVVRVDADGTKTWEASIRRKHAHEQQASPGGGAAGGERRGSPRLRPSLPTDIKLEVGKSSIEGTLYNVSEHGLGMALHTTDLSTLQRLELDDLVQVVDGAQRLNGRIRSQYPADGGCVLGIELQERLRMPGLPDIEA
jgi:hypothetical protein